MANSVVCHTSKTLWPCWRPLGAAFTYPYMYSTFYSECQELGPPTHGQGQWNLSWETTAMSDHLFLKGCIFIPNRGFHSSLQLTLPPVLGNHIFMANRAVFQDRFYCIVLVCNFWLLSQKWSYFYRLYIVLGWSYIVLRHILHCTCEHIWRMQRDLSFYVPRSIYCKFINDCPEGFIWRNSQPSLNCKIKYLQT